VRFAGPLRPVAAGGRPSAARWAGRAAVRAGQAGLGGMRSAVSAPLRGVTGALLLPARPAGAVASAGARAASAAVRQGVAVAARVGASTAAVADIGPSRDRRRVWSRGGRAHIEVRGLTGRGLDHRRLAGDVTSALTEIKGVSWAEVNAVTGLVLVVFDEDKVNVGELVEAVETVEKAHGTDADGFPWDRGPHPADEAPIAVAATALAADCLGIAAALTGRLARLGTPPRVLRAPLALIDAQPRSRPALALHLGPEGADLVIAIANAIAHGLTEGEVALATDATHRLLRLGELQAQRAAWDRREEELHSTGNGLPAERHRRVPRPSPLPPGPVEDVADKTSIASLLGAGGILAWRRDPGNAADALLATVPKAARLGREGFSAMLGRELAARGAVIFDGTALRRLDRVSAVVIDSAVLCSMRPQILSAVSTGGQAGDAEVWRLAERVLRGRSAAELQDRGPWVRGRWRLRPVPKAARTLACGPAALPMELVDESGRRCGRVTVGLELDPLADPALGAAREVAQHVLLTEHDGVTGLVPAADSVLSRTVPLAGHVRRLQAEGHVVLAVSAADDEALDASDFGIGVLPGARGVCWSADLICGPGLGEVCRILRAAAMARQVSERSARLSVGGSAVGALIVTAGPGTRRRRGGLTPVYSAALLALLSGAASARSVARLPDPAPMPRGNWHAMTAEDALEHLWEARSSSPDQHAGADDAGADGGAVTRAASQADAAPAGAAGTPASAAGTPADAGGPPAACPDPPAGTHMDGGDGRGGAAPAPDAAGLITSAVAFPAWSALEFVRLVRDELHDPLTPVLALGAVASAVVGSTVDAALVASVMVGNALISGSQRMRAERALRRLLLSEEIMARRVTLPATCGGRSGGDRAGSGRIAGEGSQAAGDRPFAALPGTPAEIIDALPDAPAGMVRGRDLAVGDIIRLGPQDVVPADARLLLSDDLEVDESTLTGESVPVTKTTEPTPGVPLAERTCMVYEGSTVLAGTAHAVVTASGAATEAGRAAGTAGRAAPPAGLQARLAELSRIALPATGVGGLAVTGMGLLRGVPLREAVASGVAVAVAAVPEGLPLVATVSELAAARRLSKWGVLVRSARALEALGRVDTICFDKTGTLTEGRISVARLALPGADISFDSWPGRRLLQAAARACPQADGGGTGRMAHATDLAVVEAAHKHVGTDPSWRLLDELPFETSRGYAASIGEEQGRTSLAVKGAPEVVLARCTAVTSGAAVNGDSQANRRAASVRFTPGRRRQARALVDDLAGQGLRILAVAEADHPELAEQYRQASGRVADVAGGLTLIGFIAFADTSRPTAREAVRRLHESGVRVIMITGDHPATAVAIAKQNGIPEADRVLAGPEIDRLSEAASAERINASMVFARVSPEHKVHIVRLLQRAGHVVAMIGDGTNDAAAIRVADAGIGVSARGSTAARTSADLVLTDPDPARVADALLEGRALWASARDAVSILLGGNAGEVAFVLLGTFVTGRAPLNTRQLLLVNLLTDMLPALAVAVAPAASADGNGRPSAATGPAGSYMGNGLLRDVAVRGGGTALGGLVAWQAGRLTGRRRRADTMGLAGVVFTELGQTLLTNWRSPLVIATSTVSAAVLAGIVETPGVSQFFGCTPLGPVGWTLATWSAAGATTASAIAPRLLPRPVPVGSAADLSS
jgi:cation-transporting P-type ATPase I